jgi:hypothetical protein
VRQIPDAVDTAVCAPDDGWKYHPKHVEQFPVINKLCNVASCWLYEYIGILLEAHPILQISRIRIKLSEPKVSGMALHFHFSLSHNEVILNYTKTQIYCLPYLIK